MQSKTKKLAYPAFDWLRKISRQANIAETNIWLGNKQKSQKFKGKKVYVHTND